MTIEISNERNDSEKPASVGGIESGYSETMESATRELLVSEFLGSSIQASSGDDAIQNSIISTDESQTDLKATSRLSFIEEAFGQNVTLKDQKPNRNRPSSGIQSHGHDFSSAAIPVIELTSPANPVVRSPQAASQSIAHQIDFNRFRPEKIVPEAADDGNNIPPSRIQGDIDQPQAPPATPMAINEFYPVTRPAKAASPDRPTALNAKGAGAGSDSLSSFGNHSPDANPTVMSPVEVMSNTTGQLTAFQASIYEPKQESAHSRYIATPLPASVHFSATELSNQGMGRTAPGASGLENIYSQTRRPVLHSLNSSESWQSGATPGLTHGKEDGDRSLKSSSFVRESISSAMGGTFEKNQSELAGDSKKDHSVSIQKEIALQQQTDLQAKEATVVSRLVPTLKMPDLGATAMSSPFASRQERSLLEPGKAFSEAADQQPKPGDQQATLVFHVQPGGAKTVVDSTYIESGSMAARIDGLNRNGLVAMSPGDLRSSGSDQSFPIRSLSKAMDSTGMQVSNKDAISIKTLGAETAASHGSEFLQASVENSVSLSSVRVVSTGLNKPGRDFDRAAEITAGLPQARKVATGSAETMDKINIQNAASVEAANLKKAQQTARPEVAKQCNPQAELDAQRQRRNEPIRSAERPSKPTLHAEQSLTVVIDTAESKNRTSIINKHRLTKSKIDERELPIVDPAFVLALLISMCGMTRGKHDTNELLGDDAAKLMVQAATSASRNYRRRTHMVESTDTLQSIAESYFHDARVAWLIADVNSLSIMEHQLEQKRVVELKSRQILELPEAHEVNEFLFKLPKDFDINNRLMTFVTDTAVNVEVLQQFFGRLLGTVEPAESRFVEVAAAKHDDNSLPELTIEGAPA